jgi:hypothetical protein
LIVWAQAHTSGGTAPCAQRDMGGQRSPISFWGRQLLEPEPTVTQHASAELGLWLLRGRSFNGHRTEPCGMLGLMNLSRWTALSTEKEGCQYAMLHAQRHALLQDMAEDAASAAGHALPSQAALHTLAMPATMHIPMASLAPAPLLGMLCQQPPFPLQCHCCSPGFRATASLICRCSWRWLPLGACPQGMVPCPCDAPAPTHTDKQPSWLGWHVPRLPTCCSSSSHPVQCSIATTALHCPSNNAPHALASASPKQFKHAQHSHSLSRRQLGFHRPPPH